MLSTGEILQAFEKIPDGHLESNHKFFQEANETFIGAFTRLGVVTKMNDTEDSTDFGDFMDALINPCSDQQDIYCNVYGCSEIFDNVSSYQAHYKSYHFFTCSVCRRSFPTAYLLDLHLMEKHDSYFAARIERGEEIFCCVLELCQMKFPSAAARKDHCIRLHGFPSNFRYFPDTKAPRKSHLPKHSNQSACRSIQDMEMVDDDEKPSTSAASSGSMKPFQFSFGHNVAKTFATRKKTENTLENMEDLKMALEESMET